MSEIHFKDTRLIATDTGTKLPPGAKLLGLGPCDRCDGPPRERCIMRLEALGVVFEYQVCAECLADFVCAPLGTASVQDERGAWQRVAARPTAQGAP